MGLTELATDDRETVEQVLGYLNFSSGTTDPGFFQGLNRLFSLVAACRSDSTTDESTPDWRQVTELLGAQLSELSRNSSTFADADQARSALEILSGVFIKRYRAFHADLLHHQDEQFLFGPFMVGRMCEALLRQDLRSNQEPEQIADAAIAELNDYIGHRPVAAFESRRHEPYPHEWVRPVPVYIEGAGVVTGKYEAIVQASLDILRDTDANLLRAAWFDPNELEELAVDPRAYDFEHPVNKRPNYHFGHWDPNCIDNRGYYRRFVVRQVTLDALLARVHEPADIPVNELIFESAAVLAGTILMATGISGDRPETHDSNTTLVSLIPRIAAYRDAFYERLLEHVSGNQAKRLTAEAHKLHQPFGGARQHLNRYLAKQRARQLAHVKLARVFARMGYRHAAKRQASHVPVASARILCRIDSCLTAGHQALDQQDLPAAQTQVDTIQDLLQRGIECGAIVDPWNILGFDANYSLFPALENSVHDHRIDDLLVIIHRVFKLFARLWSESSAANDLALSARVAEQFGQLTDWWHQFAAHEVSAVDATSARETHQAAARVASALAQWNQQGAAAGDIGFWAPHVEVFDSPSAYGLVIETLLRKQDLISSMSLLVHWLGQAPRIRLESADCSYYALTQRWLGLLIEQSLGTLDMSTNDDDTSQFAVSQPWSLLRKFLDYLEANANDYWEVPDFRLASGVSRSSDVEESSADLAEIAQDDEDGDEGLYDAAYENVVYTDSTDDGIDSSLFDTGATSDDEMVHETERIVERLSFLENLARLWLRAALAFAAVHRRDMDAFDTNSTLLTIAGWRSRAQKVLRDLDQLAKSVEEHPLPAPGGDYDSMVQYDRHRFLKESLLENIIISSETMTEANQVLAAVELAIGGDETAWESAGNFQSKGRESKKGNAADSASATDVEQQSAAFVLGCLLADRPEMAREKTHALCRMLTKREILYVPLTKGGKVATIVAARSRQRLIENLLVWLPRQGLLAETLEVLETARVMERRSPVGPGAITQFDELFEAATRQLIEAMVWASEKAPTDVSHAEETPGEDATSRENETSGVPDQELVGHIEHMTEKLLSTWLEHSKTLRLSVLEKVRKEGRWRSLVSFVEQYGAEIFTQQFLGLGNLRAILHTGVEQWFKQLEQRGEDSPAGNLIASLDKEIQRTKAAEQLTLILEAIVENYEEYRDYNSTTTQSDHGEMLYTLLDFLRLRSAYDRVMWNLKPILFAHEILVRRGRNEAAQLWRRGLAERISEEAEMYMQRLDTLQTEHAMRLSSIADRIGERFLRPMTVDRMRALVEPALCHPEETKGQHAFELLEDESNLLMREPAGSGLEVPSWLVALEDEVEQIRQVRKLGVIDDVALLIPRRRLNLDNWEEELDED